MLGIGLAGLVWLWQARSAATQGTASVSGVVMELDGGTVAGATVRQKTTTNFTISNPDGSFTLGNLPETDVTITAWQEGYLVGWATVTPPQTGITITMKKHFTTDNPDYHDRWYSPTDPSPNLGCMHCMVAYPQWQANAHGNSAANPRFFSVYNGTTIAASGVVTPGYKLDFPDAAGNCANCHAPSAAINGITTPVTPTYATYTETFLADMNTLTGVDAEGIHCEFCHKIGEVALDPGTGLPYDNAPGVLSMRLYRQPPDPNEVLFYGPFDDVTRRVSYLALEKKSQFCAPCHQFSFLGTPIYESFREWQESAYPAQGIECQTCHMKPTGVNYFVFPEKGGLIRDPNLIASHLQPGASDTALLQDTISMTVTVDPVITPTLHITVTLTNTGAGHHAPTDHPGRHIILTVKAIDGKGAELAQLSGPTVPGWGGAESGLPGQTFAKVLQDVETGEWPVISYWKQTVILSDNRIPALGSDTSTYTFPAPEYGGPVRFAVELRFRRLMQDLMDAKDWMTPDIIMEEEHFTVQTEPAWDTLWLPIIQKSYQP